MAASNSLPAHAENRAEVREMLRRERADRRAALGVFANENRRTRLAAKATALMKDQEGFDDWVCEKGGVYIHEKSRAELKELNATPFMTWFCGQVASGVSPRELCAHYMQDDGLLGAFLAENGTRLEQYRRAQQWVADMMVSEVVPISDDATPETLGVDKWRGESRLKVAAMLDPERFGRKEGGLAAGLENLADVLTRISERKQKALAAPVAEIEDAEVIEQKAPAPRETVPVEPELL